LDSSRPVEGVLFDLDGTLLDIDLDVFWGEYFARMGSEVADLVDPEAFVGQVMRSTNAMLTDTDPSRTNMQVFWTDFLGAMPLDLAELMPRIDRFYEVGFSQLGFLAKPMPLARDALICAFKLGVPVVIATNPMFPRRAIQHRLAWAGVEDLPFALITAYEDMHACKPNPAYFTEIASRLGVDPESCLMIGNDVDDDMAAVDAGLTAFLVEHAGKARMTDRAIAGRGSMADVLEYLHHIPAAAPKVKTAKGETLVDFLLRRAIAATGADTASVMLIEPEGNRLRIEGMRGLGTASKGHSVAIGEGIAGWVAQTCRAMLIDDAEHSRKRAARRKARSAMSVPFIGDDGRCIGVINVGSSRGPGQFTREHLDRLSLLAYKSAFELEAYLKTAQAGSSAPDVGP
jgi:FMN phosphatase YigB (HAD superfamily)